MQPLQPHPLLAPVLKLPAGQSYTTVFNKLTFLSECCKTGENLRMFFVNVCLNLLYFFTFILLSFGRCELQTILT